MKASSKPFPEQLGDAGSRMAKDPLSVKMFSTSTLRPAQTLECLPRSPHRTPLSPQAVYIQTPTLPMSPKLPLQFLISIAVRTKHISRAAEVEVEPKQSPNRVLKPQKNQASETTRSKSPTGKGGKERAGTEKEEQGDKVEVTKKEKMQASKERVVKTTQRS